MTAFDVGLLDPASAPDAQVVDDAAYLIAMVEVEAALLAALTTVGAAPAELADLRGDDLHPGPIDDAAVAAGSRAVGNPVIPLLAELRRVAPAAARDRLHLGATSQDILDSATMLVASRARTRIADLLRPVLEALADLAERHRATPTVGRTLGQQAAPTTMGLRLAGLLDGITRALAAVEAVELPAQLGGSVGTLAVLVDELGEDRAAAVRGTFAERLGLVDRPTTWHVERGPIAQLGCALAVLIGALGRLGLEVAHGTRAEIGELELDVPDGQGGSSAMPQKHNPVAAVLLVSAARQAPGAAATLLGAQLALDERPAGDWHAEWQPLRQLLRLAIESSALAAAVTVALAVRPDRAMQHLEDGGGAVHAERAQRVLADALGRTRAAGLVRDALAQPAFVPALLDAVATEEDAATITARLTAVTALGGPVGLSDRFITAAAAAARRTP